MQNTQTLSITPWDHVEFSVNDEGGVVAQIFGNFPDPENVSERQATDIVSNPRFLNAVSEAFALSTGALRQAFDQDENGTHSLHVEFKNIATFH